MPVADASIAAQHPAAQLRRIAPVEVLEHTDGQLQVRFQGEIILHRLAPPRPGVLRASHGAMAPSPELNSIVKRLGNHRLSQPQLRQLANLEPAPVEDDDLPSAKESADAAPPPERELTPRQLALWKAVQHAKIQGLSLREIARQLGVSRNTVRKYARALTLPTNRPHNRGYKPSPKRNIKAGY